MWSAPRSRSCRTPSSKVALDRASPDLDRSMRRFASNRSSSRGVTHPAGISRAHVLRTRRPSTNAGATRAGSACLARILRSARRRPPTRARTPTPPISRSAVRLSRIDAAEPARSRTWTRTSRRQHVGGRAPPPRPPKRSVSPRWEDWRCGSAPRRVTPSRCTDELKPTPFPVTADASTRSDVRVLEREREAAIAEEALAIAHGRPSIGVWLGYQREDTTDILLAGLRLSLPIWNRAQGERRGCQGQTASRGRESRSDLAVLRRGRSATRSRRTTPHRGQWKRSSEMWSPCSTTARGSSTRPSTLDRSR